MNIHSYDFKAFYGEILSERSNCANVKYYKYFILIILMQRLLQMIVERFGCTAIHNINASFIHINNIHAYA